MRRQQHLAAKLGVHLGLADGHRDILLQELGHHKDCPAVEHYHRNLARRLHGRLVEFRVEVAAPVHLAQARVAREKRSQGLGFGVTG